MGNAVLLWDRGAVALGERPEAWCEAGGRGLAQSGTLAFERVRVLGVFKVHSFQAQREAGSSEVQAHLQENNKAHTNTCVSWMWLLPDKSFFKKVNFGPQYNLSSDTRIPPTLMRLVLSCAIDGIGNIAQNKTFI